MNQVHLFDGSVYSLKPLPVSSQWAPGLQDPTGVTGADLRVLTQTRFLRDPGGEGPRFSLALRPFGLVDGAHLLFPWKRLRPEASGLEPSVPEPRSAIGPGGTFLLRFRWLG